MTGNLFLNMNCIFKTVQDDKFLTFKYLLSSLEGEGDYRSRVVRHLRVLEGLFLWCVFFFFLH